MSSLFDRIDDQQSVSYADKVGDLFKTLPKLPPGVLEFFVKVVPYVAVLLGIIHLIITPLGVLGTVLSLFTLNPVFVLGMVLSMVVLVVDGVILLMAYSPLQKREFKGWMLLFWAHVFYAISSIIGLVNGPAVLFSLIITAVGFYVLFQMRSFYNPIAEVVAKTTKE